jgi:HSP20 family protein
MTTYYVHPAHRMARRLSRMSDMDRVAVHVPINVTVADDVFTIAAMIPGVSADDVKIEILEDVVTINGEFSSEDSEETKYLLNELPKGNFSRRLRLPVLLDASSAEAEVKNGFLTLRVAQAEESKAKQIAVKTKK